MRTALSLAALAAALAVLAGCGGGSSSSSSTLTTPEAVCNELNGIAGTVKNLSTGITSGEASIDAITYTTTQLRKQVTQFIEDAQSLDNKNVDQLSKSLQQFRLAWGRIPPGSTPSEARAAMKAPAADVKASYQALADSLSCPKPSA